MSDEKVEVGNEGGDSFHTQSTINRSSEVKVTTNKALERASLMVLGHHIVPKHMVLAMLLNIPTKRLVDMTLVNDDTKDCDEDQQAYLMLQMWSDLRSTAKDSDKAKQLDAALRYIGKEHEADIFTERFQMDEEMTMGSFVDSNIRTSSTHS